MDTENKNSFIASKEEIIEIVKYHKKQEIDYDYWYFLTGSTSGSEAWRRVFRSNKRIGEILDLNILTQGETQKTFDGARKEYSRGIDPKVWDVFLHGSDEQYEALHTKLSYQIHGPQNWIAYRLWFVKLCI